MKAGHIGAVSLALPRQITAIAVHTLPSADRAALSGGIAVYSREELYARLEDFGS